jgi:molybdopterin-biosynthesis enzyme MoeA-like protein
VTETGDQKPPFVVRHAAAVIIGAELLSGKVRDENLFALSGTLRALGIELSKVVFCPDKQETIAEEVRTSARKFDVVFTSGGVGPTHDDVTIDGVCEALGVPAVTSPVLEALLTKIYGENTTAAHLRMARIPQGAFLAEAADIRWPTIVAENIWILPGVPELFRMKLVTVRAKLRGPMPFFSHEVFCTVEETEIKPVLDEIVARFPDVEVGSYPKWFDKRYKTRVTFDSRSEERAAEAEILARHLLGVRVIDLD